MSSSEIAKLESRWRENPQGLTFAPLAEAYRKMRDVPRALEILAEGLGRHPDYIPASIVLGRCHLDLGDETKAEAAFVRVLELDDENVIALKALADIAERHGRFDEAGRRLNALLAVDRNNDEARIQLARLEEARAAAGAEAASAATTAAEPVTEPALDEAGTAAAEPAPLEVDLREEAAIVAAPSAEDVLLEVEDNLRLESEVEQLPDLVVEAPPAISSETAAGPAMPGLVGQDFPEYSAEVRPLDDLAPGSASLAAESLADDWTPAEVGEPEALDDELPVAELEVHEEIHLEVSESSEFQIASASDDWASSIGAAGGAEYQLPSAADELAANAGAADAQEMPFIDPLAAEYGVEEALPDLAAAASAEAGQDVEPEDVEPEPEPAFADIGAAEPEEEPVVGDDRRDSAGAMAPEAVEEYADLDVPEDESIDADLIVTESMAELFLRQGHRAEALRVYRELYHRNRSDLRLRERVDELETELAAEEPPPPARVEYAAADPARSVASLLAGILAARPADAPAAWGEGAEPARPLADEAPAIESGVAAPTRPASDHLSLSAVFGEEGSPVPPAAPAPPADEGISFDAFFGGAETGGAPRARAASREDDDLDQFQAWLQNLKR